MRSLHFKLFYTVLVYLFSCSKRIIMDQTVLQTLSQQAKPHVTVAKNNKFSFITNGHGFGNSIAVDSVDTLS